MGKKLTTEEFVDRARKVHGDKYDYTKSDYTGYDEKLCITCKKHGDFLQRPADHLNCQGCPKCAKEKVSKETTGKSKRKNKKVFGIGINDYEGVVFTKKVKLESYKYWKQMLERCYSKVSPWYKGCSVCKEWLYFSNFKRWFDDPSNGYKEGYCLDKDILVKGNKLYSPDTCCFVPNEINTIFVKRESKRGDTPIGVQRKLSGKYECSMAMYGKHVRIGLFETQKEAFKAYKQNKENYIKKVAEDYFGKGKITQKVFNAMVNYKVEITD